MPGHRIEEHSLPMRRSAVVSHAIALIAGIALAMAFLPHAISGQNPLDASAPSNSANDFDRALRTIMAWMASAMCVTPSGSADRDFARAMIPHHQGAIEMARLELLHGRDDRLRRLAQGIVVEQTQEITLMRRIIDMDSIPMPR